MKAFRSQILHFIGNTLKATTPEEEKATYQYFEDGLLVINDEGKVARIGDAKELLHEFAGIPTTEFKNRLIIPGLIDTHVHLPQITMIASYGEELLGWLNKYTFPEESKFADEGYAKKVVKVFIKELLRHGTTTALVFTTVHPHTCDLLFTEAEHINMRLVAGKVMMDRAPFAPDTLRDTADSSYAETKSLIEKWHKRGRATYAVTPRFAPTSTEDQLKKCSNLLKDHPDVMLHTHFSENTDEVQLVKDLFGTETYLQAYDQYGLLGPRTVLAHSIHQTEEEWKRIAETNTALSFCPTSNLFLGSGLFNLQKAVDMDIRVSLGTDVGGGTSLCQLQSLNEAYKVLKLQKQNLNVYRALYLATLGSAKALNLDHHIGSLQVGMEADFITIDLQGSTPLIEQRLENSKSLEEKLFAIMMLGDDRAICDTYIMGKLVHSRDAAHTHC